MDSWEQKEANVGFGGKLAGSVNYRANIYYANGDGYRMVNADRFSGMFAIGSQVGKKGYLDASVNFNDDHYTTDIGGAPTMPGDVYSVDGDRLFAKMVNVTRFVTMKMYLMTSPTIACAAAM